MIRAATAAVLLWGSSVFAAGIAGVLWTAPKAWQEPPERPMRPPTYNVPPAGKDKDPGELAVFFFGQGQGGGIDENLNRWATQFKQPDGTPSDQVAKREQKAVGEGLKAHFIEVTGTYTGM